MFRWHPFLALLVVLMTGAPGDENARAQDNWVRACPGERFCFQHPPALRKVPGQVIDSLAGRYRSETLVLTYDFSLYAMTFDDLADAEVEEMTIDGRAGEMLTTDDVIALRVPEVEGRIRFAMLLEFTGGVLPDVGRRIFESIEFLVEDK